MADGDIILIGQANTASNPGNETSLSRNEATHRTVFVARNLNAGGGILGEASDDAGVFGSSTDRTGVLGRSTNSFGMRGVSTNHVGVSGSGGSTGVCGSSDSSFGVRGTSTNSVAVSGFSFRSFGGVFRGPPSSTGSSGSLRLLGTVVKSQGEYSEALPHPDGSQRLLYAPLSPESWYEDFRRGNWLKAGGE